MCTSSSPFNKLPDSVRSHRFISLAIILDSLSASSITSSSLGPALAAQKLAKKRKTDKLFESVQAGEKRAREKTVATPHVFWKLTKLLCATLGSIFSDPRESATRINDFSHFFYKSTSSKQKYCLICDALTALAFVAVGSITTSPGRDKEALQTIVGLLIQTPN